MKLHILRYQNRTGTLEIQTETLIKLSVTEVDEDEDGNSDADLRCIASTTVCHILP